MSITRCHYCFREIDTDTQPCEWIDIGNVRRMHHEIPVCESCLELRDTARETEQAAESQAMAHAEGGAS